jgi:hypothetical protein
MIAVKVMDLVGPSTTCLEHIEAGNAGQIVTAPIAARRLKSVRLLHLAGEEVAPRRAQLRYSCNAHAGFEAVPSVASFT